MRKPRGHRGQELPKGVHIHFNWTKWSKCHEKPSKPQNADTHGKKIPKKPPHGPGIDAARAPSQHVLAESERFKRVSVRSPTGGWYDPAVEKDEELWQILQNMWSGNDSDLLGAPARIPDSNGETAQMR